MSVNSPYLLAFTLILQNVVAVPPSCDLKKDFHLNNDSRSFECNGISLDQSSDSAGVVINIKFDKTLPNSKIPVLKTIFKIDDLNNDQERFYGANNTYMDVIMHTNDIHPSVWSHGSLEEGKQISKIIYVSKTRYDQFQSGFKHSKIFLVPTTAAIVKVNVSVTLEDINIPINESRNGTLMPRSPLVFRYTHLNNQTKRIRIHTTRTDSNVKEVKYFL